MTILDDWQAKGIKIHPDGLPWFERPPETGELTPNQRRALDREAQRARQEQGPIPADPEELAPGL